METLKNLKEKLGQDLILDHIAIATNDLEQTVTTYELLGISFSKEREYVEDQKVNVAFGQIDFNGKIEILEPTSDDSPIAKFLSKNRPGIHHICFNVTNLQETTKRLKNEGIQFIYPEAKIGAHNCLVNFIHPKSAGGVLIELSQKAD